MTKDSICKDCVSRQYCVYETVGSKRLDEQRFERISCKKNVGPEDAWEESDVKVLECSEFEKKK